MKLTPHSARTYILVAALLLALPAINETVYPSKAGQLLVAPAGSSAPFDDAVIYILKHNLFYAHGVVINKPQNGGPLVNGDIVYYGGPVDAGSLVEYHDITGERRPYMGYSGWGPVQLDYELLRGSWHVIRAEESILHAPADQMWRKAIEKVRTEQGIQGDVIL